MFGADRTRFGIFLIAAALHGILVSNPRFLVALVGDNPNYALVEEVKQLLIYVWLLFGDFPSFPIQHTFMDSHSNAKETAVANTQKIANNFIK